VKRAAALTLVALAVAGCGAAAGGEGKATLWVTRDRGARVLLVRTVQAGQSAMQALQRVAEVKTRYGGRYVQSIDGLAGSLSGRRDWFYFVNGIEADRGAAEYRLHPGDVEWWDYRSWRTRMEQPVVVGAFPEPFLHGFAGKARPAVVRYETARLAAGARAVGRVIHATSVASSTVPVAPGDNVFELVAGSPRFTAAKRSQGDGAGGPVRFVFAGNARELAQHPRLFRYRYGVEP
jgi:hypothetical protein